MNVVIHDAEPTDGDGKDPISFFKRLSIQSLRPGEPSSERSIARRTYLKMQWYQRVTSVSTKRDLEIVILQSPKRIAYPTRTTHKVYQLLKASQLLCLSFASFPFLPFLLSPRHEWRGLKGNW